MTEENSESGSETDADNSPARTDDASVEMSEQDTDPQSSDDPTDPFMDPQVERGESGAQPQTPSDTDSDEPRPDGDVIPELHDDIYKRPFAGADPTDVADIISVLQDMNPNAAAVVRRIDESVTDLEQENGELRQQLQQSRREFDEFKQRKDAETEQLHQSAAREFITRILPVRDDLAKAVEQENADIRDGVRIVKQQFNQVLETEGNLIDPEPGTELNPELHEVMVREQSDVPNGEIVNCLRPGFVMGDSLIRPARVTVSDD